MSFNLTDQEADALIRADFDVKFGPLQRKGSN